MSQTVALWEEMIAGGMAKTVFCLIFYIMNSLIMKPNVIFKKLHLQFWEKKWKKNEGKYFNCCDNQILLCHSKYMHKHFLANPLVKIISLFSPLTCTMTVEIKPDNRLWYSQCRQAYHPSLEHKTTAFWVLLSVSRELWLSKLLQQ